MESHRNGISYQLLAYGKPPCPVDLEFSKPTGDEVLVQVTHAGVCHSDVYIMDGHQDLGSGEKIYFAQSNMPMPLTMGHEIVGDVLEVGNRVDTKLIGKRRLIYPWIGCGDCVSCEAGQENHCESARSLGIFSQGGYSDYVVVPSSRYLIDIDGLDAAWSSTLACSGLTVYSALKQLQPIKPNSAIAIIGIGGLGLMAISMAKALGLEKIVACDLAQDRLEVARELGASDTLETASNDAAARLRDLSQNRLFGVIDTVGLPTTMDLGIQATMKGARIVLVGLQGGRIALPLPTLPFKALSLNGTYTGTLQELRDVIELAKSGALQPMPISCRPMSCLHHTLEELRSGSVVGRVVLEPESTHKKEPGK